MMNVTNGFHLFCDLWSLYRKYAGRKLTETELDAFREEAKWIYDRYGTLFAKEMLLAVINEIERNVKFFEKNGESHERK